MDHALLNAYLATTVQLIVLHVLFIRLVFQEPLLRILIFTKIHVLSPVLMDSSSITRVEPVENVIQDAPTAPVSEIAQPVLITFIFCLSMTQDILLVFLSVLLDSGSMTPNAKDVIMTARVALVHLSGNA